MEKHAGKVISMQELKMVKIDVCQLKNVKKRNSYEKRF